MIHIQQSVETTVCLPSTWLSHCLCDRLNNCRAPRRCIYIESGITQTGVDLLSGYRGRYIASGASTVVSSLITGICEIRSTGTKRWQTLIAICMSNRMMHCVPNHIDMAKVVKNVKQRKKFKIIFANVLEINYYLREQPSLCGVFDGNNYIICSSASLQNFTLLY